MVEAPKTSADMARLFAPVVRERARLIAPAAVVAGTFYAFAAPHLGMGPVPASVWVLLAALALLAVALRTGHIGDRWIHAAAAGLFWLPIFALAISLYAHPEAKMGVNFIVVAAISGIMMDSRWLAATLVALNGLAVPLLLRCGDSLADLMIATIATTSGFAVMFHVLMRRAFLRLELHRRTEAETVAKLAQQLKEVERAQRDRAQLHDQLLHAQRMEAVGTLAAGVAHDMNNVLASITGLAELLLDRMTDPKLYADTREITVQASRGAELTRGLLAFSRRGQYRKQVVHVTDVLSHVLPLLHRTLPKTIDIRTGFAIDGVRVEVDPVHLQQVLINLGVNAADAMDGKGTLTIAAIPVELAAGEHAPLPPGRYVRLRISDTGRGMDASVKARVFEPFFTTKPMGKGTGLGLSIVWGIVQAHDGAIDVESEPGQGAAFHIYLPTTEREVSPEPVAAPPVPRPAPRQATVLVVEDEAAVRESTRRLLESMGLQVMTASNGQEGLHVFTQAANAIDLVVLDMGMPVMSGAECFRHIRKLSEVPVIVATGYAVDSELQELVAAGAVVLEKPFARATLRREVARLLQRMSTELARAVV